MLKEYNKDLKHIAILCNINKSFTSYAARHSFANCLVQNGTSIDVVSESMGHSSVLVTKAYVKNLGSTILDDACESLLD